jgi:hypothetical protein
MVRTHAHTQHYKVESCTGYEIALQYQLQTDRQLIKRLRPSSFHGHSQHLEEYVPPFTTNKAIKSPKRDMIKKLDPIFVRETGTPARYGPMVSPLLTKVS